MNGRIITYAQVYLTARRVSIITIVSFLRTYLKYVYDRSKNWLTLLHLYPFLNCNGQLTKGCFKINKITITFKYQSPGIKKIGYVENLTSSMVSSIWALYILAEITLFCMGDIEVLVHWCLVLFSDTFLKDRIKANCSATDR